MHGARRSACAAHSRRSGLRVRPGSNVQLLVNPRRATCSGREEEGRDRCRRHALDYDGLETLLDRKTFSYSFGENGDPVGYWRRLEEEGEDPILGDYLPVILGGPSAKRRDVYVWPSAYGKSPSTWTAEDRQSLRNLYTEQEIRAFERAGDYLGWRVGIRNDGKWLFFVAGD